MNVKPQLTEDGSMTLHSERFGVTYHSAFGAVEESLHVFLCAGFQRLVLDGYEKINILEIGFGTGLNALLTMIETHRNQAISVNYTGVEAYPISEEVFSELGYVSYLNLPEVEDDFIKLHQVQSGELLTQQNFSFRRLDITFEELNEEGQYDLIYFDAFAPTTQPELWNEVMMKKMYTALKESGAFVTYCAKGSFKRALKASGFQIEALPGPGRKREMTRAWKVKNLD